MNTEVKDVIWGFQVNGWKFKYDPETHYIGAYHKDGGKQSICEIVHPYNRDSFGNEIADLLNGKSEPNDI